VASPAKRVRWRLTQRTVCASLSFVTAAMAVSSCSGASPTTRATTTAVTAGSTGHAAFVARVDAVCADAVAKHAGHPFPIPGFEPEHPTPSQLPAVGDYFERYGGLPATTAALHALTPPTDDSAAWHTLLGIADRLAANSRRQVDAARARDVTTFVITVHTANGLIDALNAAGKRLGFSDASPCRQVFG
jgi:hypothetical protein